MIFCVEDDGNIRELVIYTLATTGMQARGFEEGKSFFKALEEEIEKKIAERQACKKARDYAGADAIRDELAAKGIILEDTREGCKWHRA